MRLYSLQIVGLRRLRDVTVVFGDATFLIGVNNSGKSSVLKAIDHLLSAKTTLPETEFYSEPQEETGERVVVEDTIQLTAEFRNLPEEAREWRGFRGRILDYSVPEGSEDTGHSLTYRKTYKLGQSAVIQVRAKKRERKEAFAAAKTPQDLIEAGLPAPDVQKRFPNLSRAFTAKEKPLLDAFDDMWEITDEEEWFTNPGGIPQVVLSRLPSFLLIAAEASKGEIDTPKGTLVRTLAELFKDVREASENYSQAQGYLDKLTCELDPGDEGSEFGKMMTELNEVLQLVFPETQIHAVASLSDPDSALSPTFNVEMSSNVRTPVSQQGTGSVRSAVFGLLKYRKKWEARRDETTSRSLIIGFEEPEIYLHPSAANQMRNAIYELATGSSQIVATTHSPFIIDLSRRPRQVLNRFQPGAAGVNSVPLTVTDAFEALAADDKSYVKMLLKIDDHVARVFFTETAMIVEGDTEDLAIRESLARLSEPARLAIQSKFEVVRARGKGSIIGLVKYLRSLGVDLHVIHDRDGNTPGAVVFNEPILAAVGDPDRVTVLEECLEDVLGYAPPSRDKPYRAFVEIGRLGGEWTDLPEVWREHLCRAFGDVIDASSGELVEALNDSERGA